MGGAAQSVQRVGQAIGLDKKPADQVRQEMRAAGGSVIEPTVERATRSEEEMGSRMRGARRRGRALLSDARLMGETGVETLGGGTNLG